MQILGWRACYYYPQTELLLLLLLLLSVSASLISEVRVDADPGMARLAPELGEGGHTHVSTMEVARIVLCFGLCVCV